MTNASNPQAVKDAKQKQQLREEREVEDLKAVLATESGRRFVWRVLSSCQIYTSPLNGNGTIQSAYIGRQDVGRELLTWLAQVDPVTYPQLMLEMAAVQP